MKAGVDHPGLSVLYGVGTDKALAGNRRTLNRSFLKTGGGEDLLMMRRINWPKRPQQAMLTRSRISSAQWVKLCKSCHDSFRIRDKLKCAHRKPMDRFPFFVV
jgi:hypothetical protein